MVASTSQCQSSHCISSLHMSHNAVATIHAINPRQTVMKEPGLFECAAVWFDGEEQTGYVSVHHWQVCAHHRNSSIGQRCRTSYPCCRTSYPPFPLGLSRPHYGYYGMFQQWSRSLEVVLLHRKYAPSLFLMESEARQEVGKRNGIVHPLNFQNKTQCANSRK